MYVKKRRGDSYCYMLIGYVILLVNTSWYIYGNVIFFDKNNACGPILTSTVRTMLWLGYLTMCKCCIYSCVLGVGIPLLCYLRRRLEQPNWEAANNNVLSRLAVSKFGGLVNRDEDSAKDCVICYEEFKADDEVTTLPCN